MSESKTKVTKEVLCEDCRFILANVMAEARYRRQNGYAEIRQVCEGAITVPFSEYIAFLSSAGYLTYDRANETLEVTKAGENIVNGGDLDALMERAVNYFKTMRRREPKPSSNPPVQKKQPPPPPEPEPRAFDPDRTNEVEVIRVHEPPAPPAPPPAAPPAPPPAAPPAPASEAKADRASGPLKVTASEGRSSASVGGEIRTGSINIGDGRYQKHEVIGSGGIGTVYRARQISLNREVALKEMRELFGYFGPDARNELIRRFTEVVRAAAHLAHPNIVMTHELSLDGEYPYVVSEYLPAGSCRSLIQKPQDLPVETVLKYLVQALHALRAAHDRNVSHRGLKPENLLLDNYGNIKISDFGLQRVVERDMERIKQVYVGTSNIAYMAPELYHEPGRGDAQSDIYAIGIIFYELVAHRLPGRRSPMPSQINPRLPAGIDDIFDRMTRDVTTERYFRIDDILSDLFSLPGVVEMTGMAAEMMAGDTSVRIRVDDAGMDVTDMDAGDPVLTSTDDPNKPGYRPYSYGQRRKS